MSLGCEVMPLFRQLGIDEKFIAMSKYSRFSAGRKEDGPDLEPLDFLAREEL